MFAEKKIQCWGSIGKKLTKASIHIYILDGAESIFDISFEIQYLGGPLNPLKF